jgi:IS30 family transposase
VPPLSIRPKTVDLSTKIPDCRIKESGTFTQEIAENIGTSEPTISREFKRNTGKRGYRPKQAHIKALCRKQNATKAIKMTENVILLVN